MKNFAFISLQLPTDEQRMKAFAQGVALHHIGHAGDYAGDPSWIEAAARERGVKFYGVIVDPNSPSGPF